MKTDYYYTVRHYYRTPSAKRYNFVTMLFYGIEIPRLSMRMLHAMSLNLPALLTDFTGSALLLIRQSGSDARVYACSY